MPVMMFVMACYGVTFVLTVLHRDLPDQHPEDRGGEPRLPEEARQGAHQLQQAAESSRDHRRDPAVPEPALLLTGRERYQGKARFTHHRPQYSCMGSWELEQCEITLEQLAGFLGITFKYILLDCK